MMSEQQDQKYAHWKGLLLAGGTGSRLYPSTVTTNKHLLPVYDKPLIYYSLSTLMLTGLRDVVIVSSGHSLTVIEDILGDGAQWGMQLSYREQKEPRGIADAVNAAADALEGFNVALTLGDNMFYGAGLPSILRQALDENAGATIFGYQVKDASAFGVVSIDADMNATKIEEKPKNSSSNLAVPGLYFYDKDLLSITKNLQPSARGELEITDVNRHYLERKKLKVVQLGRGIAWLDSGSPKDLFEAGQFVKVLEERTGTKIACPEEIAWRQNWIDSNYLQNLTDSLPDGDYQKYLSSLISS